MASEERCRLTYAEGRRIRDKAIRPYMRNLAILMLIGIAVLLVGQWISELLAGVPIGASGTNVLGERILEGDAGSIGVLTDYVSNLQIIAWLGGMCVGGALMLMIFSEVAAKKALKEANDEKVQEEVYRRDPQRTTGRQSAASPHGQEYGEDWPSRTVHWQKRPHTRHVKTSAADPEDGES